MKPDLDIADKIVSSILSQWSNRIFPAKILTWFKLAQILDIFKSLEKPYHRAFLSTECSKQKL